MDALVDLSWRAYPGGALMALGTMLAVYGFGRLAAWRSVSAVDGSQALVFVRGLAGVLVGFAVAGGGGPARRVSSRPTG